MANVLVVEGQMDQDFFEHLIVRMQLVTDVQVSSLEIKNSKGQARLHIVLEDIIAGLQNGQQAMGDSLSIGIILDYDHDPVTARFKHLNDEIKKARHDYLQCSTIERLDTFYPFRVAANDPDEQPLDFTMAFHLFGYEGRGELETVLKAVKHEERSSRAADCILECLEANTIPRSIKEIDKDWLTHYVRYDVCANERNNKDCAANKLKYVLMKEPPLFNLDHVALDAVKQFIQMFR